MTTPAKSVINHDLIVAARQGLLPVRENSWLGGFRNMLQKELSWWWGTSAWWIQTLIWILLMNGVTTIVAIQAVQSSGMQPNEVLQNVTQTFLEIGAFAVAIGTIITLQGTVVGEKQSGTAAWVMSKPASRSAFILAKIVGNGLGFWVTAIIVPATIFVVEMQLLIPAPLPLSNYLIALALLMLSQLFYLILTVMLGTFFTSRGPVTGIGIGFILSGMLFKGFLPLVVMVITPWLLPQIGNALIFGLPLPSIWFVPIAVTTIWIVIMTVLALWRFGREEF